MDANVLNKSRGAPFNAFYNHPSFVQTLSYVMDLEVDDRGCEAEPKIISSDHGEKITATTLINGSGARNDSLPNPPPRQMQASPVWLLVVFAITVSVAAVAAGVAISIAVQQQSKLKSCIKTSSDMKTRLNSSNAAGMSSSSACNTSSATAPSIRYIKPMSDCQSHPSSYTSVRQSTFTTYCNTDLNFAGMQGAPDFAGVYVYTFEDCINACSIFNDRAADHRGNLTCYGVSYNLASGPNEGNCWLKGSENIPFYRSSSVDSAVLDNN